MYEPADKLETLITPSTYVITASGQPSTNISPKTILPPVTLTVVLPDLANTNEISLNSTEELIHSDENSEEETTEEEPDDDFTIDAEEEEMDFDDMDMEGDDVE